MKANLKRMDANVAKGRTKDSMKAFGKLTTIVDGEPRITGDPPLIVPIEDVAGDQVDRLNEFLHTVIRSYRRTLAGDRRKLLERYRYVHAARKVVGVGSVGTRAWICLLLGRDGDDPLFLQFKEAQHSVLEPFLGTQRVRELRPAGGRGPAPDAGRERHHARLDQDRGHRRRQARLLHPPALGLEDVGRGRAPGAAGPRDLRPDLRHRACARSCAGRRRRRDREYLGAGDTFDRAMARFAESYADQNERDYAALKTAVEVGRVSAEFGL